jgi:predicted PurR-regulated permease PerM
MLGIDRQAARVTWTVFLIGLLIFLVYQARETLLVFGLALFFAYMISPVITVVERFAPKRISPNVALAVVYLLLVGAIIGIGFAVGEAIADQATMLAAKLPELVKSQDPLGGLWLPGWLGPLRERVLEAIRGQLSHLDTNAIPILRKAATEVLAHAGTVLTVVLIPILAFFFLKDGRQIKEAFITWTTDGRNSVLLDEILADVHVMLGRYIRALLILSMATFMVYTIFLQVTGGQYSVLLGGVAAVLEFIPVVGPLSAAVIILIVEGFSGYGHIVGLLALMLVYRLFQDYVLSPYLMGSGVELHPLLVLFGVLAGEQIGGVPGMFFSVPVLAILRVIYVRLERSRAASRIT